MKLPLSLIIFLLIGCWVAPSALATNPPTKLTIDGKEMTAEHTVAGAVDLYTVYFPEEKIVVVNGQVQVRKIYNKLRYCLVVNSETVVLTKYNYKKLLKRYLPNAPDLHRQLGKTGFQYENILYMVEYYNSFHAAR